MYNLKQRITVGIATFAIAASTLGAVPAVAFADEAAEPATDEQVEPKTWGRISGPTALDTMLALVKTGKDISFDDEDGNTFRLFDEGGTVIVASADGYHDALAASSIAGDKSSPIVLTSKSELSAQAKEAIELLKPAKIIVIGGDEAVSDDVVNALVGYAEVTRISGKTAVDTAIEIFDKGDMAASDYAIVATSDGFHDALAIAPFSAYGSVPIFLTNGGATPEERVLSDESLKAIRDGKFSTVLIAGGDEMVSKKVEEQLADIEVTAQRLSGATAIETSAEVAKHELGMGMTRKHLAVASAAGYWDALAGGAYVGQLNSVMALAGVEGGTEAVDALYKGHESEVEAGIVFGGDESISDATLNHLNGREDANEEKAETTSYWSGEYVHTGHYNRVAYYRESEDSDECSLLLVTANYNTDGGMQAALKTGKPSMHLKDVKAGDVVSIDGRPVFDVKSVGEDGTIEAAFYDWDERTYNVTLKKDSDSSNFDERYAKTKDILVMLQ